MPLSDSDIANRALDELIKKHILIFGLDITLNQLHQIKGLEIDENAQIVAFNGTKQELEKEILQTWTILSFFLSKKIAEPEIEKTSQVL